ncbi:hypothetical protein HYX13_01550 [Candidatus Woesearchaeota archaeon]|nr:hypothetical protein [Candidatus Woesearchaeota archaeon]
MTADDEFINEIRLGNSYYDFTNFMPKFSEHKSNSLKPNDRFADAFYHLSQALHQAEERRKKYSVSEKHQENITYPFETGEEQQGIFRIEGQAVNLCKFPFTTVGMISQNSPYNFLFPYTKFLEAFVEKSFQRKYEERVNYYSAVKVYHGELPEVIVPKAADISFDRMYRACLIQPAKGKERILYQITDGDYQEVFGAGFLYKHKEKNLQIQEIKRL